MLAGTLAFISGIYCLMQLSALPSLWLLTLLPLLFFLSRFFSSLRLVLFFLFGFCWALFCADLKLKHTLDADIENTEVSIKGVIVSIPEVHHDHVRFLIDIKEINGLAGRRFLSPGLVRLSWYKNKDVPVPGEIWQLRVKLKRPHGFMNPGGFDYEAWMFRRDIKATGYVKIDPGNQKIAVNQAYFFQKLRYKISSELKQTLDKPLLGLVLALTLGDRSQLNSEQWQILNQTGTNHLIAISGLHLSLVAGFVYILACFVWSRFYFLTQRVPAPLFALVISFVGALFYALLAGFALPAQRALIMIGVFLIAIFSARKIPIINVICISLVLVLLLDPFAIVAVDFYLSFMAVIFIFYISRFRVSQNYNLTRWIRLQCLLSIALCPILIFWFKQIPLYSVLANLVAIPVIGFLVVPLILMALVFLFTIPQLAQSLYEVVAKIDKVNWHYLEFLSQQSNALIPIAAPNLWSLVSAIMGILILIMPRGLPARWLGLLFLVPLLFPLSEKLEQGEFDFGLLDAGQGLAAVIQTKEHSLVYDTGAQFSERFNIGDAVLKPYLRIKGINHLSMLLVSHGDNDHIGGVNAVIKNFKISKVLSSVPTVFTERFPQQDSASCHAGQKWQWDGVDFEILHPKINSLFEGNNASCVLKVTSEFGAVLLTGDIEKEAEKSLVANYNKKLHADILVVPHHGSRTSSTEAFISAVLPKYAFIPAGYRNRFGFPKKDIMARYGVYGVETFVNYKTGELSVKFRHEGLLINEFRTKRRRFWHH